VSALGAKVRRGDLQDLEGLMEAAADSDGVIHVAHRQDLLPFGGMDAVSAAELPIMLAYGEALAGTGKPLVAAGSIGSSGQLGRPATREDILAAWAEFRPLAGQGLPTAPEQPVEWAPQNDRPQPRLDRNRANGMASTVGRLRPCGLLDWKFVVLSHNTIRGAAGATILNAELLASMGKLEPVAEAVA